MDFTFTREQREFQQQARSFLEHRFPPQVVASLADSQEGWEVDSWEAIANLGWLGVSVPESEGGAGLTFLEEAILLEEFGRCLYPGPFMSSIGLARPAIPADRLGGWRRGAPAGLWPWRPARSWSQTSPPWMQWWSSGIGSYGWSRHRERWNGQSIPPARWGDSAK